MDVIAIHITYNKIYPFICSCGTGWPFSKTEGFTMSGTTGKSPVFKLFRIKKGSNLNIKCSFFVCKENCDGVS